MTLHHVNNVIGVDAAFYGSQGSPYATMAYASAACSPGDSILVQNSGTTYTETFLINSVSGTAGNEITLRPEDYANPPKMAPTSPLRWRGVDYWIIEGLYFDYDSALDGDGSIIRIGETTTASTMCTNFTIRRCYFYHSSYSGLFLEHCEDVLVEMCHFLDLRRRVAGADTGALELKYVAHNITIRYCVFEDIGSDGIEIEEKDLVGPDTSVIGDITIQYCDFFINRPYGSKAWHDLGTNTADDDNVGENAIDCKDHNIGDGTIIIEYCNIHGFYSTVAGQDASGSSGEGISLHNDTAPLTQPVIIRYCRIWDCDQGITLNDNTGGGVGAWIFSNIITDCHVFSLNLIDCRNYGVRIEQNTIVNNTGQLRLGGVSTINTFRNNLIANNGTLLYGTITKGTFSNNLYYNVGTVPGGYSGSGDVTSDPDLDEYYAPNAGSPALGAGVNLGHTLDFVGQTRPTNHAIGALEQWPALGAGVILHDDFAHRSREAWTVEDPNSSLWISPRARDLDGSSEWGLSVGMDSTANAYLERSLDALTGVTATIWVDPNNKTMANNDDHGILAFVEGSTVVGTVRLRYTSGDYRIVVRILQNDTTQAYASDAFGDIITDEPHKVEVTVIWADGTGSITLTIDDVLISSTDGLSNGNYSPDGVRYGRIGGIDAGSVDAESYLLLGPITLAEPESETPPPDPVTPSPAVSIGFVAYRPPAAAAQYAIWLSTPTGQRIKFIDPEADLLRLDYVRAVNTPGQMVMRLRNSFGQLFQEDSRIEVERRLPEGMALDTDTVWLVRDWDEVYTEQREEYIELRAVSAMELLDRRIVAYASGNPRASKTDQIDDMMKAIVRENMAEDVTDNDRLIVGLTVEPDQAAGPTGSKGFSRKNVLATLQDLSQDSIRLGTPVYFDINGHLIFQTFVGQRGADHGRSSGQRVVLSRDNGSLTDIRRSYISADERNYVYAGGQGQGDDRQIVTVSDTLRISRSVFNRREIFIDARNTDDEDEITAEASAALREWRPRQRFTGKVIDSPALRYGRDWNFGDRVVVQHGDFVAEALINEIRVSLEAGQETIRAGLSVEE